MIEKKEVYYRKDKYYTSREAMIKDEYKAMLDSTIQAEFRSLSCMHQKAIVNYIADNVAGLFDDFVYASEVIDAELYDLGGN